MNFSLTRTIPQLFSLLTDHNAERSVPAACTSGMPGINPAGKVLQIHTGICNAKWQDKYSPGRDIPAGASVSPRQH
jgi:hypothetical protein